MIRGNTREVISLRHFFDDCVTFFHQRQPSTEEKYMMGYFYASHVWLALSQKMDTLPLPRQLKNDIIKLFTLSEDFFQEINLADDVYRTPLMQQKWEEMRLLANRVYQSGKQAGF